MAAFPTYARLLFNVYMHDRAPAVWRTDTELGVPKQAKRYSRVLIGRRVTCMLDKKSDYDAFIAWFNTTIHRGASWFEWVDPYDRVTKQARIRGGELKESAVRSTLDVWSVEFVLETWSS